MQRLGVLIMKQNLKIILIDLFLTIIVVLLANYMFDSIFSIRTAIISGLILSIPTILFLTLKKNNS